MNSIIFALIIFVTNNSIFCQDNKNEASVLIQKAFIAYENKEYKEAEELFEKAFNIDKSVVTAAYMIGLLNLYNLSVDYSKAIKYLLYVESDIPSDLNKNNFYNHIGTAFLYSAVDKKNNSLPYEVERIKSEKYFRHAMKFGTNDFTYNNLGRVMIESEDITNLEKSIYYFEKAIEYNPKPAYIHNEATAFERIGHYYSGLVKSEKKDINYLKKSYEYFNKAVDLYKSNRGYTKSQQRATLVEKIYISRKVYDQFRDKK